MKKQTKIIEYIDATPAAGKTREARRLIYNHIATEAGHIVVYAAPTHKLLEEVEAGIKDVLWEKSYTKKVVKIGDSKPTVKYAYLMGFITDQEAERAVGSASMAKLRAVKKSCRVILCTHECLIRAPKGETKESRTATIIFDEARNCVLRDFEFKASKVSVWRINSIFKLNQVLAEDTVSIGGVKYLSKMAALNSSSFPDTGKLLKTFKVSALADLPSYVLDLYKLKDVCEGGRVEVLIETLSPVQGQRETRSFMLGLSRPSNIFEGYGRVIVMSAYFTHSQMYHMLLNAHIGHQQGDCVFELVPYATSNQFNARSKVITKNSRKNIRIGALLKDTQSGVLTSSFLSRGLVVTPEIQRALTTSCTLKKGDIIERAFKKLPVDGLTKSENRILHACANPPLLMMHREAYRVMQANDIERALCFTNSVDSMSSGSKYWIGNTKVMNTVDFLISAPLSTDDAYHERERGYMTESMVAHVRESTAQNMFKIPASTSVLGLNEYDGLDAFVHLAALNPKPAVARMLKRVLPNYQPTIDYAISNIVQTMYRTSLRKPRSESKVFCLVVTDWIIEQIENICFGGKRLSRIPDYKPRFTELNYVQHDTEKKRKAGRASGSARKVNIPDEIRKELQKLQNGIKELTQKSKAKRAGRMRDIAKQYPDSSKNIQNWLSKYSL